MRYQVHVCHKPRHYTENSQSGPLRSQDRKSFSREKRSPRRHDFSVRHVTLAWKVWLREQGYTPTTIALSCLAIVFDFILNVQVVAIHV